MKLKTINIEEKNSFEMKTEIFFGITEAKALGFDVLKMRPSNLDSKSLNALDKCLKSAKKEGLIQLYVNSDELKERTTGAEYLYNLYAELEAISDDAYFLLIKL